MPFFENLIRFLRRLLRKPASDPGRVEDTPQMELEIERRRGMRGD